MRPQVLLECFIAPTIKELSGYAEGLGGPATAQLMLVTAQVESRCGANFEQINGPAKSPWQLEPDTVQDLYENFLDYRPRLANMLDQFKHPFDSGHTLVTNPLYACALARLVYYRYPEPMPELNDCDGMWEFYKKRYNSSEGATTKAQWDTAWNAVAKLVQTS